MNLSTKQMIFSQLFPSFLKYASIFEPFEKKMTLIYFCNYGVQKRWIFKCLKSAVSKHPSTVNMLKGPKHL